MIGRSCARAIVAIAALGASSCYRSVELGKEQIAQLAVTDPGRIALDDRSGHQHSLANAQALTLQTERGDVDCTDWGPATTAIRCTSGEHVELDAIKGASLTVASPARTTLVIAGPLAAAAALATVLFHQRASSAEDEYQGLGPDADPDAFDETHGRAERYYNARNVALGIAITAGVGVAAGALWGALFEE